MDGDDAYTFCHITLDGLARQTLVPFLQETVDAGRVLTDVVGQLVVERTDVGTLSVEAFKGEDGMQVFHQFV